jgi:hypothetical protein
VCRICVHDRVKYSCNDCKLAKETPLEELAVDLGDTAGMDMLTKAANSFLY